MGSDGGAGYYVVPADPNSGAGLKKKGVIGSRSWILMDSLGQETVLDVDKYEIMDRVQIHARDLRILDPLLSYPSAILGRERAIVLNLEHIKAIITADSDGPPTRSPVAILCSYLCKTESRDLYQVIQVLLRDPLEDNVVPVVEELRRRIKPINANSSEDQGEGHKDVFALLPDFETLTGEDDESPFEFRALEVALEAICSYLAARVIELETDVYPALDMLTSKINSRNLDRVRKLKSQMTRLTARVQKVRDELEQLLDDDDDMADLYLSRKMADASSPVSCSGSASWLLASPTVGSKISRASRASVGTVRGDENDVEELEMLLEAYFMQIDTTLSKLSTLREYTDSTEDYINIQLDNYRNQLIQLELFLSSGTVSTSILSLTIGIFGMNIPFSWNNGHASMFTWVVFFSGLLSALVFIYVISYARCKGLVGS